MPASYAAAVAEASLESKGLFADASRFGRLLRSPGVRTTGKVLGTGATVIGYAGDAYNIGYVTYTYGQTTADTMRDVANTYQAVQENPGQTVLDQIVSSGLDNSGFYTTLSKNIHAGTLRRRDIHGGDRWAYNPWNWFFTSY